MPHRVKRESLTKSDLLRPTHSPICRPVLRVSADRKRSGTSNCRVIYSWKESGIKLLNYWDDLRSRKFCEPTKGSNLKMRILQVIMSCLAMALLLISIVSVEPVGARVIYSKQKGQGTNTANIIQAPKRPCSSGFLRDNRGRCRKFVWSWNGFPCPGPFVRL